MEDNEKNTRTKYLNQYRKERFKQLNDDVPFKLMKDFEKKLKEQNITKRQFIYKCIIDFLDDKKDIKKK